MHMQPPWQTSAFIVRCTQDATSERNKFACAVPPNSNFQCHLITVIGSSKKVTYLPTRAWLLPIGDVLFHTLVFHHIKPTSLFKSITSAMSGDLPTPLFHDSHTNHIFWKGHPTFFWFENLVRPCAHLTDSRCRDVPTLPWCGDVHNTSLFFFAVITLFRFKSVENIRFGLGCDGDVPTPLLWWRTFHIWIIFCK